MQAKALRSISRRRQRRPALSTSFFLSSRMRDSILKMAGSSQRLLTFCRRRPIRRRYADRRGIEKHFFILNLFKGPYRGFFQHIVVLCPTVRHNKTYWQCPWIWTDPEFYILDPGERLHDYLQAFYHIFMCEPTLYIIDDCSASTALTKKKDMLSMLAFSGRHAEQSVSALTQKYNSVLKDLREQTRWVCLFHCKDRDSFED